MAISYEDRFGPKYRLNLRSFWWQMIFWFSTTVIFVPLATCRMDRSFWLRLIRYTVVCLKLTHFRYPYFLENVSLLRILSVFSIFSVHKFLSQFWFSKTFICCSTVLLQDLSLLKTMKIVVPKEIKKIKSHFSYILEKKSRNFGKCVTFMHVKGSGNFRKCVSFTHVSFTHTTVFNS